MDWVVEVSEEERSQGSLSEEARKRARTALNRFGCALLRGVFETGRVEELRSTSLLTFYPPHSQQTTTQAETINADLLAFLRS